MATHQEEKVSRPTTIHNFRDISTHVNAIKPGLLFRAGNTDTASDEDLTYLRENLGIKSVIDLRGMRPWPMIHSSMAPGNHDGGYIAQYPDKIAHIRVLGLNMHYISLQSRQMLDNLYSQSSWLERTKVMAQITFTPVAGVKSYTKLLETQASKDRTFIHELAIDLSFMQMKALFKVLADPRSFPIMIIDNWGRGLVSLVICLVLFLLDADEHEMSRDHMQSDQELASSRQERLEELRNQNLPDEWVNSMPEYVGFVDKYLRTKYGGIEKYLTTIGLDDTDLQSIKSTLQSDSRVREQKELLVDV